MPCALAERSYVRKKKANVRLLDMESGMFFLGALAAASSLLFNLDCTGTRTVDSWVGLSRTPISNTQVRASFRVDLKSGLWCSGDCSTTSALADVNDGFVVFQKSSGDSGRSFTRVNRRTGELQELDRTDLLKAMLVTSTNGTCERKPFGGFPAKKF